MIEWIKSLFTPTHIMVENKIHIFTITDEERLAMIDTYTRNGWKIDEITPHSASFSKEPHPRSVKENKDEF